ncbi:MAG: IS630 family transposase [Candidatus Micrarchaeota archaeon]
MLEQDESVLRELAAHCKDAKEKVRLLALHAVSKSHSVNLVSEIFCVDDSTLREWIDKWLIQRSVSDEARSGRPPVLSEKDKTKIKELVEEGDPKKHGVNASAWSTNELQYYFAQRGKVVCRNAFRVALKSMGAHYVKAIITYEEADEELQRKFSSHFFKVLSKKPSDVVVLFGDEMSAGCQPRKGYGWTFEERLVVKTPQKKGRKRLNLFGAVNPEQGELVQMASKKSKAPTFVKFLRKILQKYKGRKVWLYLDNFRVHKSKVASKFLQKHGSIELRFLPPYSPDLNPQEAWWNHLRAKWLNNHFFETPHELALSISGFTRLTPPETVQSVCTLEPLRQLL